MSADLNFPPSLSEEVRARSFEAPNGELGVFPSDTLTFLDACVADGVQVLGWDLWLADHRHGIGGPEPCLGSWTGLIPIAGEEPLGVFAYEGDVAATRNQLAALNWAEIEAKWLTHVRVNFTLTGNQHTVTGEFRARA